MDIKHSRFKSLTAVLKACAKEGLIKIKETKGGMVVTGTNQLRAAERRFNGDFYTGVDRSHSDVQAHVHHVTIKDVEGHKGKQGEAQAQEMERFQEERHEQQVMLLRKHSPVTAAFFRSIGEE